MSRDLQHWTAEDFTDALGVVDGVKDGIVHGSPTVDTGRTIVETFGFEPILTYRFAQAYVRDVHAQVTEWGGDTTDVATTAWLDGAMLGLALAVTAGGTDG